MRQDSRDLAHAGIYICCLVFLVGSCVLAGAAAFRDAPSSPLYSWAAALDVSQAPESTHLSRSVATAREIRAALERPIARPEPLPPITAKLAQGHLRPGASGAHANRQKLPQEANDAMAMDVSAAQRFRASSAVTPDLHRVY